MPSSSKLFAITGLKQKKKVALAQGQEPDDLETKQSNKKNIRKNRINNIKMLQEDTFASGDTMYEYYTTPGIGAETALITEPNPHEYLPDDAISDTQPFLSTTRGSQLTSHTLKKHHSRVAVAPAIPIFEAKDRKTRKSMFMSELVRKAKRNNEKKYLLTLLKKKQRMKKKKKIQLQRVIASKSRKAQKLAIDFEKENVEIEQEETKVEQYRVSMYVFTLTLTHFKFIFFFIKISYLVNCTKNIFSQYMQERGRWEDDQYTCSIFLWKRVKLFAAITSIVVTFLLVLFLLKCLGINIGPFEGSSGIFSPSQDDVDEARDFHNHHTLAQNGTFIDSSSVR